MIGNINTNTTCSILLTANFSSSANFCPKARPATLHQYCTSLTGMHFFHYFTSLQLDAFETFEFLWSLPVASYGMS